jgi:hypothetical protein
VNRHGGAAAFSARRKLKAIHPPFWEATGTRVAGMREGLTPDAVHPRMCMCSIHERAKDDTVSRCDLGRVIELTDQFRVFPAGEHNCPWAA